MFVALGSQRGLTHSGGDPQWAPVGGGLAGARQDLLDLDAGTLAIEITRVVDGRVIKSDGKTENAQHVLALDPFTLAALKAHVQRLEQERRELGSTITITACCSGGRTAGHRTRTPSCDGSSSALANRHDRSASSQ